jgi:crotonobetainyl-CoA:carnitine CoA-transferase CaiB-like acyl-CoA transferase
VNDVADFAKHPALRRVAVETPNGVVSLAAPPVIHSDGPRALGPVPALGEHSEAVRAEFG